MPVIHKELLGDKLKAAQWVPFAVSKLRIMRSVGLATTTYAPNKYVSIVIRRTSAQERIIIRAKYGVFGYEFITWIDGEGTYRTHHESGSADKATSAVLENTLVLSNYNVEDAGPGPDFGGVHNNQWYKGNTAVTGGLQRRYQSTFDTTASAPVDRPPEVVDFAKNTRTRGPLSMLVNAAAMNNGVLVGIDSQGEVFAADSISESGSFIQVTPEYPSWVDRVGPDLEWTSFWRFNHDGTKAVSLMYQVDGDPSGVDPYGAIIELEITPVRDEDGVLTMSVSIEQHELVRGKTVFAVDYKKDIVDGVATSKVVTAYLYSTQNGAYDVDAVQDLHQFVIIEDLDSNRLFYTLVRFRHLGQGTGYDRDAFDSFAYMEYLDLSNLAATLHSVWYGPYSTSVLDVLHYISLETRIGEYSEIIEDGAPTIEFNKAVTPDEFDAYDHPTLGDLPMIGSASGVYLAEVNRAVTVSQDSKSWGVWNAMDPENFSVRPGELTISAIEQDIVVFGSGLETTHRELYNTLRDEQLADAVPDPLPELPTLVQIPSVNAAPMLNSAWYPRR